MKLIGSVNWFTDDETKKPAVLPPGNVGLIPHNFVNAETPGQLPDSGDSGCGCVARPAGDVAARRLVGVATEARGAGQSRLLAFAARADAILPWVERAAYTQPESFEPPTDTVINKPAVPSEDWDWDDGRNFFADMNGDGLDDFIYFGDKKNVYVQHAKGDGTFGALFASPDEHFADIHLVALARWPGPPGSTPSARGYRSQLVTTSADASLGYEGASIGIRLHDGTSERVLYTKIAGKAWQSLVSIDAGAHFDATGDALIARRYPDPTSPGDRGAVALLPPDPQGGFAVLAAKFWSPPDAMYAGVPFLVADIDGDGGVDLVADMGENFHVFSAIPGSTPWSTTPILRPVPAGCRPELGGRTTLTDVTGDGRADLVCINDKETGLLVLAGTSTTQFDDAVKTPFEISGYTAGALHRHPWGDAILSDLDGDGLRDYVTFFDNALWFKLNDAKGVTKPTSTGRFGVLQRFEMPPASKATFGLSFDAPHVRSKVPRSVVVVAYRPDNVPVLREMPAWPRQDR